MVNISDVCYEAWSKEPDEWSQNVFIEMNNYNPNTKWHYFHSIFGESQYIHIDVLKAQTYNLIDSIIHLNLCPDSNREARQLIKNGAIFINNSKNKIKDINYRLSEKDILSNKDFIVIGKKADYNFYQILRG